MAVQQRKKSRSRRGMRRAHDLLCPPTLSIDPHSGELHLRHHIAPDGRYCGRRIVEPKPKKDRTEEQKEA